MGRDKDNDTVDPLGSSPHRRRDEGHRGQARRPQLQARAKPAHRQACLPIQPPA